MRRYTIIAELPDKTSDKLCADIENKYGGKVVICEPDVKWAVNPPKSLLYKGNVITRTLDKLYSAIVGDCPLHEDRKPMWIDDSVMVKGEQIGKLG